MKLATTHGRVEILRLKEDITRGFYGKRVPRDPGTKGLRPL